MQYRSIRVLFGPGLPTSSSTEMHEIAILKGTNPYPCLQQRRGNLGEDSSEWKPGRWLKPLPESVSSAHVPGVFSQLLVTHF